MATIILQTIETAKSGATGQGTAKRDGSVSATVASSPGRLYYATLNGIARTFERVGTDGSGNEVYRDQKRY